VVHASQPQIRKQHLICPAKVFFINFLIFKGAAQLASELKKTKSITQTQDTTNKNKTPELHPRVKTEPYSKFFDTMKEVRYPDRYNVEIILGTGSMGEVRRVYDTFTKQRRAMKVIPRKGTNTAIMNEIEVLKKLDHPSIMRLYDFYEDDNFYYLITEYCAGGELFDHIVEIKNFTEEDAAFIMHEILGAVAYCHEKGIVHRDLKPENILYETSSQDSHIKIIDFGTAAIFDGENLNKTLGSVF